jgi:hypothetical protein
MSPRIKLSKCSVRISTMGINYGFKTIGSFHKFLKQCNPNAALFQGYTHIRIHHILRMVESELKS